MNFTKLAGLLSRAGLTAGGGAAVATDANDLSQWLGIISLCAGIIWSIIEQVRAKQALKDAANFTSPRARKLIGPLLLALMACSIAAQPLPPAPPIEDPEPLLDAEDLDADQTTEPLAAAATIAQDPTVKIDFVPAYNMTVTWSNLPPAFASGYRIQTSDALTNGWNLAGTSSAAVKTVTWQSRVSTTTYFRLTPLSGIDASPVYILQWRGLTPEIVTWHPPAQPEPEPEPTPPTPIDFAPIADAYLEAGSRFNTQQLRIEPGRRIAYLKFDAAGLTNPISSAVLHLTENGDSGTGTIRASLGATSNWSETTLTTNNAPAKAKALGSFTGPIATAQAIAIPLALETAGLLTIILEMDPGANDAWFGSRESPRPPRLTVTSQ